MKERRKKESKRKKRKICPFIGERIGLREEGRERHERQKEEPMAQRQGEVERKLEEVTESDSLAGEGGRSLAA